MNFKRYWNEHTTVIEKAYFVKEADLTGWVKVFTDIQEAPKWEDIETNHQQRLREVIELTLGGKPE